MEDNQDLVSCLNLDNVPLFLAMHVTGIITGFHLCHRALLSNPPCQGQSQALLSVPHDLACIIVEVRLAHMSSVSGKRHFSARPEPEQINTSGSVSSLALGT